MNRETKRKVIKTVGWVGLLLPVYLAGILTVWAMIGIGSLEYFIVGFAIGGICYYMGRRVLRMGDFIDGQVDRNKAR